MLTDGVPPSLIDEVVDTVGCRERRVRRLPTRAVVYFVLAWCLLSGSDGFCPPGYRAVAQQLRRRWRKLSAVGVAVTSSAVTQARQRVGSKVFEVLFERVSAWCAAFDAGRPRVFGLRVVAWDATTVQVWDSPDNAERFGYHGGVEGKSGTTRGSAVGANPLVRLMALLDCRSHVLIDAVFDGVARASEQVLARRLLAALRPGMLVLADRNFPGYELWGLAAATGADLLWRVKKNVIFIPIRVLPDGSFLARMPTPAETVRLGAARHAGRPAIPQHGHLVRVVEYTVGTEGSTDTESFRLVTTLLDHHVAPAPQLAALYHERWESENGYSFLKPRLIGRGTALRSRTPEGVEQELYAFLIVYQTLCHLRAQAATEADLDPDRVSFLVTIRTVRAQITEALTTPPDPIQIRRDVIADILDDQLGERRPRSSPRQRVPHTGKYTSKRRDTPRPATRTNHKIRIAHTELTSTLIRQHKPPN